MHARVITFRGAKNIDEGLTFLQERVVPLVRDQQGYRGLTASADRDNGVFGVLSLWETEADRDASDKVLADTRQEGLNVIGGDMSVRNFEQVLVQMGDTPPGPGSSLLVQDVSMDQAKVEDNVAFFERDVAPRIKANSGFLGLRQLVNRATGEAIVGSAWTDTDAMTRALTQGQDRRQEATSRGVSFDEMSTREILFSDLP